MVNYFSKLIEGQIYGKNSRKIYEGFCETLNWDISKANQFGRQGTPLYAQNADKNRERDVWFISYPNYDKYKLGTRINAKHIVNLITDNGEKITEIVDDSLGRSNDADRITFVKTNEGYMFLGVYEIVENGITRVFKRVSTTYPL